MSCYSLSLQKNPYNKTSSTDFIKMDFKLNNVVSMWKVREMVDKATNLVMNYTETESKVIWSCMPVRKYMPLKHYYTFHCSYENEIELKYFRSEMQLTMILGVPLAYKCKKLHHSHLLMKHFLRQWECCGKDFYRTTEPIGGEPISPSSYLTT